MSVHFMTMKKAKRQFLFLTNHANVNISSFVKGTEYEYQGAEVFKLHLDSGAAT